MVARGASNCKRSISANYVGLFPIDFQWTHRAGHLEQDSAQRASKNCRRRLENLTTGIVMREGPTKQRLKNGTPQGSKTITHTSHRDHLWQTPLLRSGIAQPSRLGEEACIEKRTLRGYSLFVTANNVECTHTCKWKECEHTFSCWPFRLWERLLTLTTESSPKGFDTRKGRTGRGERTLAEHSKELADVDGAQKVDFYGVSVRRVVITLSELMGGHTSIRLQTNATTSEECHGQATWYFKQHTTLSRCSSNTNQEETNHCTNNY